MVPPRFTPQLWGFIFDFCFFLVYHVGMYKFIDAHCHILTDAQMRDARAHGVGRFIVNATSPGDWNAVVESARDEGVFGAIGVHPWYVNGLTDDWDDKLVKILATNPKLMVGEIGLDKNHPNFDAQLSVFRRQLQIAHDMGRTAHIHMIGAWGKCMDILRGEKLPPAMVFHAFSGAVDLVPELVKKNAYFSFGAAVIDPLHARLRLSVAAAPESRILVESDTMSSDVLPNIIFEISKIRSVENEKMASIIYNNTMGILNDKQV